MGARCTVGQIGDNNKKKDIVKSNVSPETDSCSYFFLDWAERKLQGYKRDSAPSGFDHHRV